MAKVNPEFELTIKQAKFINKMTKVIYPISLHDDIVRKCVIILIEYPMKENKMKIFLELDKKEKVGMLNRHILSVASKIGIYDSFTNKVYRCIENNKRYKKYNKSQNDAYWKEAYDRNQIELSKYHRLLLDIMLEELHRRSSVKYLRNKKLKEIAFNSH